MAMEYVDAIDWMVWRLIPDQDLRVAWKEILKAIDAIHKKGKLSYDTKYLKTHEFLRTNLCGFITDKTDFFRTRI